MSDSVRRSSAKRPLPRNENVIDADDIKRAGNEILSSYKALEAVWKKAEEVLSHAHVPEDVKVQVSEEYIGSGDEPSGKEIFYLGYARMKGQWRICLAVQEQEWDLPGGSIRWTWTPIAEASVEWRMVMVQHFPALAAEVVATTRRYINDIQAKAKELETALDLLDL